MELHKDGVLCTKKNLWKKPKLILQVVDYMVKSNYEFVELVYGEPNNFIFADEYHEIEPILKKKGFYGVRIKFKNSTNIIEVHANVNGIQNVKYDVFTESEMAFMEVQKHLDSISNIIGSTNEGLVKGEELLYRKRKWVLILISIITLFGLISFGVVSYILEQLAWILGAFPIFTILLIYYYFRRR